MPGFPNCSRCALVGPNLLAARDIAQLRRDSTGCLRGTIARAFPKAEGDLFLSLTPLLMAVVGLVAHAARVWTSSTVPPGVRPEGAPARWRRIVVLLAALLLVSQVIAFVVILFTGGFDIQIAGLLLRVRNLARAFRLAALAAGVLLLLSPRARNVARGVPRSLVAFSLAAFVAPGTTRPAISA